MADCLGRDLADSFYDVSRVGPMTKADIPASAVDFHVSSIIEELINVKDIAHKAKVFVVMQWYMNSPRREKSSSGIFLLACGNTGCCFSLSSGLSTQMQQL